MKHFIERIRHSRIGPKFNRWESVIRHPVKAIHYRRFRQRNRTRSRNVNNQQVFFDVRPRQYYALNEYLYQLLLFLVDGGNVDVTYFYDLNFEGFRSLFVNPRPQQDLFQPMLELENVRYSNQLPDATSDFIYIHDDDGKFSELDWKKTIKLEFDGLLGYRAMKRGDPSDYFLPYPMFLHLYAKGLHRELSCLRTRPRKIRSMFAGGEAEAYRRQGKPMLEENNVLDRCEVMEIVDSLDEDSCVKATSFEAFEGLLSPRKFVRPKGIYFPFETWLETLGSTDFFLCPPGVGMPMCHNIVEALAVGTVPITNYPDWFPVPLEHGVNCMTFETESDLRQVIREVLSMGQSAVDRMKAASAEYYDQHCTPEAFLRTLDEIPTKGAALHVNCERMIPTKSA